MNAEHLAVVALLACAPFPAARAAHPQACWVEMPAEVLKDKIRGGLLGQLLGNLNGLEHEMKYIARPGRVEQYTPALPDGARTDDDTDLEWVYTAAMHRERVIVLPSQRITQLWKSHINDHIWCANRYARRLMDLGVDPPLTGSVALNPWSDFNISGQFVCETFGLLSPGMPRTAARLGLHYTHVTIDGEPAQTTQAFTSMIATAFVTDRLEAILGAGEAAVDPSCVIYQILADVGRWHREHPRDWRATRRLVQQKYSRYGGAMRDRNGYELNTAATVAALLYGEGDLVRTLTTAFNFGWDADNNAATSGTIVGVIKGRRWMHRQGWNVRDRYRNTTRPGMPQDETITSFADRLCELAERVILQNGGTKQTREGRDVYRIRVHEAANVEPLLNVGEHTKRLRSRLKAEIEAGLAAEAPQARARAAYLAICLDLSETLRRRHPRHWADALAALKEYPGLRSALRDSPGPAGQRLRARARTAGWLRDVR